MCPLSTGAGSCVFDLLLGPDKAGDFVVFKPQKGGSLGVFWSVSREGGKMTLSRLGWEPAGI